jgi:hypothetical protein
MHLQRLVFLQAHPQSGEDLRRYFRGHGSPDYGYSQEAVLPHKIKVMCGHNVLTFDDLSTLAKRLCCTTLLRFVSQDHNVGPMVIVSYTKAMMIAMHREAVEPYKTQLCSLAILLRQVRQWLVSNPADR